MQKKLTLAAILGGCALISYALWSPASHSHHDEEDHDHDHSHESEYIEFSPEQIKAHGIDVHIASPGTLQQIVRAPAKITIASDKIAHIFPKTSGIVLKAHKNLGEHVAENETLVTLESKEMAEAKSGYLSALKKEQLTKSAFDREKLLHDQKISADQDFHAAQNSWEESLIDLELAHQKLCSLGLCDEETFGLPQAPSSQLRVFEVRSPIKGCIVSHHVTPGELVANDHEIYIVADLSTVWAVISVFSQDRQQVKQGQPITITTHDGQRALATVSYLSPIIDEETRTSTAIAEVDNSSETWLPGTFVQAELTTNAQPVFLAVPKGAVQNIDGRDCLFVVEKEGFVVRPIMIGKSDEQYYEVLSGIEPGERYAAKNTFLLKADLKKSEAEHMD